MAALRSTADQVLKDLVADDTFSRKVFASFDAYRRQVRESSRLAEQAYLNTRG
jgi:TRAP-type mannitol/chloroaromatic compound transport system substrate-binding protein